jgi:hypothetical protein
MLNITAKKPFISDNVTLPCLSHKRNREEFARVLVRRFRKYEHSMVSQSVFQKRFQLIYRFFTWLITGLHRKETTTFMIRPRGLNQLCNMLTMCLRDTYPRTVNFQPSKKAVNQLKSVSGKHFAKPWSVRTSKSLLPLVLYAWFTNQTHVEYYS